MLRQSCQLLTKIIRSNIARTIVRSSSTTKPTRTHHDLPSFLAHARSTSLSPTSTVYIGTHYEYLCLSTLRRLAFTLTRTGGRSDNGIDLLGHWHLPSLPQPLRALVQCKALSSKNTPSLIRELEGIYAGAPAGWRDNGENGNTVAVLCGKKPATQGLRTAMRNSKVPVVWILIEDLGGKEDAEGRVRQVLWNARVRELGAEGVGVGLRYLPAGEEGVRMEKEAFLTWDGKAWELGLEGKDGGS
ncbi:MAG: hypothetical protein L6R41_000664 [Letrouitia leprolyta]|nr:MAG: hypothetical protein L6R41_000664 [Letrouitia leprolyta]